MALAEALRPDTLLVYEMNGEPLPPLHGFPRWYGVANVKWLTRIESVTRDRRKSMPAKVTRQGDTYNIMGAAWGAPIAGVEVRIDDGEWSPATLTEGDGSGYAWTFWTYDWGTPTPGERTVTSRAIAVNGEVQPVPDDPLLAGKQTFWESNGQITRRVSIT